MLKKVISTFLIFSTFSFAALSAGEIEFKPEKKVFKKSEKVCFYLKNNSDQKIYLPSSAPWAVFQDKKYEKVVYSPIAMQSIIEIKPSEEKKWCWEQKDFKNEQVPSGEYTIRLTAFQNGKKIFLSSSVQIKNSQ
ncbi:hypothetical protein [Persephonella sp. KM09-Lau-8]|uniref:hypothetical protein n=1 Tax=Persephonella sp. KM09-Lau-8 TaxID=1158345 RepID=UPI00068CDC1F|nr:hypothetical protein [Persephonella sp. KM09-Lau-8]